jgi:hypothetical protein
MTSLAMSSGYRRKSIQSSGTLQISKSSGLVQLKKLLPLDVLYQEQHAGAVGALWERHHKSFAAFIRKTKPMAILEIGGAHGILERKYQLFGQIPWTILEPNPSPVDGCKAQFIQGFFDEKFVYEEAFDTVVHSHVFEHIYRPEDFMVHLSGFMDAGKKLIFSICRVPDDCIDLRRYPLLIARDVMRGLIEQFCSESVGVSQPC